MSLLAILLLTSAANAAFVYDSDVIYQWNDFINTHARSGLFLAEYREAALVWLSAYAAVNCVNHGSGSGTTISSCPSPSNASVYNAANAAIWQMWRTCIQTRPSAFNSTPYWSTQTGGVAAFLTAADNQYNTVRTYIQTQTGASNAKLLNGELVGTSAAAAVWAIRGNDGFNRTSFFTPACTTLPCGAGQYFSPFADNRIPFAQWANITLFCDEPAAGGSNNHAQFYVVPPTAAFSKYANDSADVIFLVGKNDTLPPARTASMLYTARFWQESSSFLYHVPIIKALEPLTLQQATRGLGLVYASTTDSNIMQYDNKFKHQYWRPWQRNNWPTTVKTDTDNSLSWRPVLNTPPHPEYPAGHPMSTATWTRAFELAFPQLQTQNFPATVLYNVTSLVDPSTRYIFTYNNLNEINYDVTYARMWAGFHYPFSVMQGQRIGQIIADYCYQKLSPFMPAS